MSGYEPLGAKRNPGRQSAFTDTPGDLRKGYQFSALTFHPNQIRPYLKAVNNDLELAHRLYIWNIQTSAQLWAVLHIFETSFRCHIFDLIRSSAQKQDWWRDPTIIAVHDLEKFSTYSSEERIPLFLINRLFSQKYLRSLWIPLFEPLYIESGKRRKDIFIALESIRKLRNIIAHHGRIHNFNFEQSLTAMSLSLKYLDKPTSEWIENFDLSGFISERNEIIRDSSRKSW